MYTHHFGLRQDPFSIAPDPRYLFMSERHREALAHLLYGVAGAPGTAGGSGGGFVLLTGDIGTGKTTICRCFLEQIPPGCHVAYIFNPKLSVLELLQSSCEEFHISLEAISANTPTSKDYTDALNAFLLRSHAGGQSSVLIIDEAQNLAPEVLEQLRLLTNLETSERKLLQIVLIGQPELRTMLARAELEQLAQRVIARFHLDALNASETAQYITHRLAVAGHTGAPPFERRALQRIYRLTHGVPRRINLLCGRSLLGAWATGQHQVTRAVVNKAATEVFGTAHYEHKNWYKEPVNMTLVTLLLIATLVASVYSLQTNQQTEQSFKHVPTEATAQPSMPASGTAMSASAATPTEPRATIPAKSLEDLDTLLPLLPTDMNVAWRELALVWKLPANQGDPCQDTAAPSFRCYQTTKLNALQLRQLARPGILSLQSIDKVTTYAVVTGFSEQTATLQVAGLQRQVRLLALTRLWRGDFATYWQPPEGYSANLPDASSGPAIEWLTTQLGRLDGMASPTGNNGSPTLDAALRVRIRTFQSTRGITADGQPGPMTFMQLERALGIQTPPLPSAQHSEP